MEEGTVMTLRTGNRDNKRQIRRRVHYQSEFYKRRERERDMHFGRPSIQRRADEYGPVINRFYREHEME